MSLPSPNDHDAVVGRVAIGYFGVMGIPIGNPAGNADDVVNAPAIGVRYWMSESFGLEAGVGLGFGTTGATSFSMDTADVDGGMTGEFGFMLHAGLPSSIHAGAHYNALLIPEINLGFTSGIIDTDPSTTSDDQFMSGFMFNLGVRGGAEFHLEFLDLPQLTLQLTLGIGMAIETRTQENNNEAGVTNGSFNIRTDGVSLSEVLSSSVNLFFYL